MDSRDSSVPPSHRYQSAVLLGQNTPNQLSNPYPLYANSVSPAISAVMTHQQQNPRFPFDSVVAAPAPQPADHHYSDGSPSGGGGASGFCIEPTRKKRGRPRKYSPDNSIGLGLSSAPVNQATSALGNADSTGAGGVQSSETAVKRSRGRPPGSVKKQMNALGVPGVGFTPHVIMVDVGEDIASKIKEFCQQGPRTVCILSANGSISNVTLRQSTTHGGTVTYEGRFEIISLSGSFLLYENAGNSNLAGSLCVSLAGSDGRVMGGGVAGTLKAASTVQIVVGSFIADGKKSKSKLSAPLSSHPLNFNAPGVGVSPPSPDASSESADENDESPLNCSSGPYGNTSQPIQNMSMYSPMGWPNSIKMHPS